jgi:hypothetical protein
MAPKPSDRAAVASVMSGQLPEMLAQDVPRKLSSVEDIREALVKTYRWLTLVAALLITVCEVVLFSSQVAKRPLKPSSVGAAVDTDSGTGTHRSFSAIASLYWAAARAQTPPRVR